MRIQSNRQKEAAEDIFFGQVVIIWARWFVIAAGMIYVLWQATDTSELAMTILPLILVMAVNFFVHGRYLMEKPINQILLANIERHRHPGGHGSHFHGIQPGGLRQSTIHLLLSILSSLCLCVPTDDNGRLHPRHLTGLPDRLPAARSVTGHQWSCF